MFPQKSRLTKEELEEIRKKGIQIHSPHLLLFYLRGKNRFGVVVSKKVSTQAVARNKLKRRIRAILKNNPLPQKNSIDGLVFTKQKASTLTFEKLTSEVEGILKKIK